MLRTPLFWILYVMFTTVAASGLLVSGTQTSTQSYDYQIASAATGTSVHYTGKVEGQMSINLVEFEAMQPQTQP